MDEHVKNQYNDIKDIYFALDSKKIDAEMATRKIRNLCFYFLQLSYDKKK